MKTIMKSKAKLSVAAVLTAIFSIGAASAADYKHKDWPVVGDGNGGYSFTAQGTTKAVPLCTAFYAADVNVMVENNATASQTGRIVHDHAVTMRDAFGKLYKGSAAELDELVKDMTWHFGNSAQYGAFQNFKDSANLACEQQAMEKQLVTIDYIIDFNDKLFASLGR